MVTTKEIETHLKSFEQTFTEAQELTTKTLDSLQKTLESLVSSIASLNGEKKILIDEDGGIETPDFDRSIVECAQIQFPMFDGTNFQDWRVKAEQFFELEATPIAQRGQLLLLSMDGKAFSWQRHYIQQPSFKDKSWEQILQDVAYRFDDSAFDDPVAELSRLKQEEDLGEYLEAFDSLLARVGVSESMALSFFLSGLKTELEKSVRFHKPQSLQEAVHIARLQEEILKELEKKM